jgi:hypothetical protein
MVAGIGFRIAPEWGFCADLPLVEPAPDRADRQRDGPVERGVPRQVAAAAVVAEKAGAAVDGGQVVAVGIAGEDDRAVPGAASRGTVLGTGVPVFRCGAAVPGRCHR